MSDKNRNIKEKIASGRPIPDVVRDFALKATKVPINETDGDTAWVLLEAVLDQMPVGVLMIDAASERVLLRNKKFDEITQMPPITYFREYEKYFTAQYRNGTKYAPEECPIIRSVIFDETIIDEEMIFKHAGGELALSVNSAPIIDKSGKLIAAVALYGDITARAMVASHVEFLSEASAILASSLDKKEIMQRIAILCATNVSDGCTIDLFNDEGAAELYATHYRDPEKLEYVLKMRKKGYLDVNSKIGAGMVLRTGRSTLYHKIRPAVVGQLTQDKEYSDLLASSGLSSAIIVPIRDDQGILGAITFTSASQDRLFEKSDLRLAEELARRIGVTLQNIRLYSDAKSAVSLRDDFITMASHELRTPLTTMITITHLLEGQMKKKNDREMLSLLSEINGQLWNFSTLINQMLDLSRIQGGKIEYRKETFDMNELIAEIVEREQKASTEHTITLLPCPKNPPIVGDRERLGHVVSNLISNAIKFSPPGEIVVASQLKDGKQYVSVKDHGIGIPEEHFEKIFQRFHQVSDVDNKSRPGLGIGLYISAEIVINHGGRIWCESEQGKGSTFYFTVPLAPPLPQIEI